ncbi:hypothetical protein HHK36_020370 [Tetracentron sinense]|uniref:Uncharacterized protein n=1 Tax=Tetracentron sinense TaxID=13715 RepID=A0A834YRH8_TETSI|nr:hypothetical protein HHK36_020370 [Tetracentron sinense]
MAIMSRHGTQYKVGPSQAEVESHSQAGKEVTGERGNYFWFIMFLPRIPIRTVKLAQAAGYFVRKTIIMVAVIGRSRSTEMVEVLYNMNWDQTSCCGKMGKRTPRFPVSYSNDKYDREKYVSLNKQDESSAFDALQTLADISLMMPASTIESGKYFMLIEFNFSHLYSLRKKKGLLIWLIGLSVREAMFANHQRDKPKISGTEEKRNQSNVEVMALKNSELGRDSSIDRSALSEAKQRINQPTNKMQKRKFKSLASKLQIPKSKTHSNSHLSEPQKT